MSRFLSKLLLLACLLQFSNATPLRLSKRLFSMDSVLQFDPPTLTINDTTGMTSFKVSLMAGPQANGQVEVQFKSDTLMFSTCHVLFNATNYDQPASINVWPKPTYVDAAKAIADDSNFGHTTAYTNDVVVDTLPIELNINGNGYENATAIYNVTRNVVPAAYCGISGDPHFSTFDNGRVNSADIGYHYYVKSDYLTIQGAQFECMASGATCIQDLAIQYGDSKILIYGPRISEGANSVTAAGIAAAKQKLQVQATNAQNGTGGENINHENYQVQINNDGSVVTVILADMSTITISLQMTNVNAEGSSKGLDNFVYLAVHIGLTPFYRHKLSPQGLCGNFNGDPNDDMLVANLGVASGKAAAVDAYWRSVGIFMDWFMAGNKSLVDGVNLFGPAMDALLPVGGSGSLCHNCVSFDIAHPPNIVLSDNTAQSPPGVIELPIAPNSTICIPEQFNGTTHQVIDFVADVHANITLEGGITQDTEFIVNVTHHCEDVINSIKCEKWVDHTYHIQICIQDALAVGSYDPIEQAKQNFVTACALTVATIQSSNYGNSKGYEEAHQTIQSLGVFDNQCPSQCSNHGTCSSCGCKCDAGWSGVDCSISQQSLVPPPVQNITYIPVIQSPPTVNNYNVNNYNNYNNYGIAPSNSSVEAADANQGGGYGSPVPSAVESDNEIPTVTPTIPATLPTPTQPPKKCKKKKTNAYRYLNLKI